jgi:hypothetical protein
VLLALIGKGWLTATDNQGQPRLGQAGDWVRLEIEAALERNVPVVPTLVEGATMPSSDELPDSLKPLAARQGIELRDGAPWDSDVDRLLRALERIAGEKAERDTASPPKIQAEREAVEAPPEPGGRQADAEPKRPSVAPANAFAARTAQLTSFGMTPQAAQLLTMNLLRALEQDENILAACRYADATLPTPDGDAVAHAKPGALHARPSRYAGNVVATERQLVIVAGWPKVERHVNLPWSRIRAVRMDVEPYRIWRFSVREGARITVTLADSATELSFVSYDLERAKALRDVASARIRAARS